MQFGSVIHLGLVGKVAANGCTGFGHNLYETAAYINGIVKAEVAVAKEYMTAHFAGEINPCFLHIHLYVGVSSLIHNRDAAILFDVVKQVFGAFDVGYYFLAGIGFQIITRQDV